MTELLPELHAALTKLEALDPADLDATVAAVTAFSRATQRAAAELSPDTLDAPSAVDLFLRSTAAGAVALSKLVASTRTEPTDDAAAARQRTLRALGEELQAATANLARLGAAHLGATRPRRAER